MVERAPVQIPVALGYRESGGVEGSIDELRIVLPEPEMELGPRIPVRASASDNVQWSEYTSAPTSKLERSRDDEALTMSVGIRADDSRTRRCAIAERFGW